MKLIITEPFFHLSIFIFLIFLSGKRSTKSFLAFLGVFYIVFLISPIPTFLNYQLSLLSQDFYKAPSKPAIGIVLSGGTVLKSKSTGHYKHHKNSERIISAVLAYQNGTISKLIIAGKDEQPGYYSEAESMRLIAIELGVHPDHIELEPESKNTFEHTVNLKKKYNPKTLGDVFIITSFSHLYRSVKMFRKQGFSAYTFQKPTQPKYQFSLKNPFEMKEVFYELFALIRYKVKGYI